MVLIQTHRQSTYDLSGNASTECYALHDLSCDMAVISFQRILVSSAKTTMWKASADVEHAYREIVHVSDLLTFLRLETASFAACLLMRPAAFHKDPHAGTPTQRSTAPRGISTNADGHAKTLAEFRLT